MAHHHHIRLLTPPSRKAGAGARAGVLLWSAAFPVALHALALDPAEHALYAGGGDGRIFELALAGQPGSDRAGSGLGAGIGAGIANGHTGRSSAPDRDVGWVALEGHARCVTCLHMTTDGGYLLSGAHPLSLPPHACMTPGCCAGLAPNLELLAEREDTQKWRR